MLVSFDLVRSITTNEDIFAGVAVNLILPAPGWIYGGNPLYYIVAVPCNVAVVTDNDVVACSSRDRVIDRFARHTLIKAAYDNIVAVTSVYNIRTANIGIRAVYVIGLCAAVASHHDAVVAKDYIGLLVSFDLVRSITTNEDIFAGVAVNLILPAPGWIYGGNPLYYIVAVPCNVAVVTDNDVVACSSRDRVIDRFARHTLIKAAYDNIVAVTSVYNIRTANIGIRAVYVIGLCAAVASHHDAVVAKDYVIVTAPLDRVSTNTADKDIVSAVSINGIRAAVTRISGFNPFCRITAVPADFPIIPDDDVITAPADDAIGLIACQDNVITGAAVDIIAPASSGVRCVDIVGFRAPVAAYYNTIVTQDDVISFVTVNVIRSGTADDDIRILVSIDRVISTIADIVKIGGDSLNHIAVVPFDVGMVSHKDILPTFAGELIFSGTADQDIFRLPAVQDIVPADARICRVDVVVILGIGIIPDYDTIITQDNIGVVAAVYSVGPDTADEDIQATFAINGIIPSIVRVCGLNSLDGIAAAPGDTATIPYNNVIARITGDVIAAESAKNNIGSGPAAYGIRTADGRRDSKDVIVICCTGIFPHHHTAVAQDDIRAAVSVDRIIGSTADQDVVTLPAMDGIRASCICIC